MSSADETDCVWTSGNMFLLLKEKKMENSGADVKKKANKNFKSNKNRSVISKRKYEKKSLVDI